MAVKKLDGGLPPTDDFEALYEVYRQKKNWSHEFMADRYTNIIAKVLEDVHPLLNDQSFIDGYNANTLWDWDDFYKELACTGLHDTTKGQEHKLEDDYATNRSLYLHGAKANSTKTPKCDE